MRKLVVAILAAAIAGFACLAQPALAQNQINIVNTRGGVATFIPEAPTYVDAHLLAAGVSETAAVPSGARLVIFSATCNFYAKTGASATVPAADVTNGSASALNPSAWGVSDVSQISLIASSSCIVTLTYYG